MDNIHSIINELILLHKKCYDDTKFVSNYDEVKLSNCEFIVADCCDSDVANFLTKVHNNFKAVIDYIEGLELDIEYYKDREDLNHERYRYNDY